MSSFSRFLLGTGVGVGIYAGIRYMLGLKRMQDEIEIIPTVNIHKLDLKGLVIKIDVQMKNPTQGTVNLQFPYVKLQYKGIQFIKNLPLMILLPKHKVSITKYWKE